MRARLPRRQPGARAAPVKRALALLSLVALAAAAAHAAAPPVVSWREAGGHVGEVVTVEGEVATASTVGDTWVLEFARDDPRAFRVVVLLPLPYRERRPAPRPRDPREPRTRGRHQLPLKGRRGATVVAAGAGAARPPPRPPRTLAQSPPPLPSSSVSTKMSISSEPLLPFWLVTVGVAVYSPTFA